MSTSLPDGAGLHPSQRQARPATDLAGELRYLVRSAEPAIVFSSLAHLCVRVFSEGCTVDIAEDDEVAYRIGYPWSDPDAGTDPAGNLTGRHRTWGDRGYAVRTRFASAGYTGMMTHLWHHRVPTPADVSRALILVRHGVDIVREERQGGARQHSQDAAEQLRAVAAVASTLDPAVAALLAARARRLRQWARCERERIARP